MTGPVISALVPPTTVPSGPGARGGLPPGGRRRLPLPQLAAPRTAALVYGLATVDCRGRVADTVLMAALGWPPGTRLDVREHRGLVLVTADLQGVFSVTTQGHLRLPATVRRWCGLQTGNRVLLTADPAAGLLVVHPPAALDEMIGLFHARVLGGETR